MAKRKSSRPSSEPQKLRVIQSDEGSWQLKHPRCARARREDLDEVEKIIAAEEYEIAQDELRWLLSECHDFLAAHKLLGDVALAQGDFRLARGHYGYAYQLGVQAVDRTNGVELLPYANESNQPFFQAGRGLVLCLAKLNKPSLQRDVIRRLLELDPRDPLGIRSLLQPSPKHRRKHR